MRLLLDTHIALWAVTDDPRLSNRARDLISDRDNTVAVSAVSLWEIAIKRALERPGPNPIAVEASTALELFRRAEFDTVDVTAAQAVAVERLPNIHGDPFDRLLVAQALHGGYRLLTRDDLVASYSDTVIRV